MYWRNNGCTQYDGTWVLEGTMWNLSGVLSWNLLTFSAIDMNGEPTARPTWTDSLLCNVCFSIQPLPQKLHYHKVCQSQVARRKEDAQIIITFTVGRGVTWSVACTLERVSVQKWNSRVFVNAGVFGFCSFTTGICRISSPHLLRFDTHQLHHLRSKLLQNWPLKSQENHGFLSKWMNRNCCRKTHLSEAATIKLLLLPWLCILQRLYITILCSRLVLLCCSTIPQQMPGPERIISIRAHLLSNEPNLLPWKWTNLLPIDHNP